MNSNLFNEIKEANDPRETRQKLVADYQEKFASPCKAAELGYVDEIIEPEETRLRSSRHWIF